tara:strand:+ start:857 stop:976 length:120 start_codon:yes stop_codon:yes gene_type:complete
LAKDRFWGFNLNITAVLPKKELRFIPKWLINSNKKAAPT